MTALFDEPLRVTLRPDRYPVETDHPVGMLLGFTLEQFDSQKRPPAKTLLAVVVLADGSVTLLPPAAYTIDWRYSVETDRFIDTNVPEDDRDT